MLAQHIHISPPCELRGSGFLQPALQAASTQCRVETLTAGQAIVLDGDGEVAGAEELGHAVLAHSLDGHHVDEAAVRHAHLHELRGARAGHDDDAAKGAHREGGAEEREPRLSIDGTRYAAVRDPARDGSQTHEDRVHVARVSDLTAQERYLPHMYLAGVQPSLAGHRAHINGSVGGLLKKTPALSGWQVSWSRVSSRTVRSEPAKIERVSLAAQKNACSTSAHGSPFWSRRCGRDC